MRLKQKQIQLLKAAAIVVLKQALNMQALGNAVNRVLVMPQPVNRPAPQFKALKLVLAEAHEHLHEPLTKAHSEYEASVNQRTAQQNDKVLFMDFAQLLLNLEFAFNAKNHPNLMDAPKQAMLDIFDILQKPAMNLAQLRNMYEISPPLIANLITPFEKGGGFAEAKTGGIFRLKLLFLSTHMHK